MPEHGIYTPTNGATLGDVPQHIGVVGTTESYVTVRALHRGKLRPLSLGRRQDPSSGWTTSPRLRSARPVICAIGSKKEKRNAAMTPPLVPRMRNAETRTCEFAPCGIGRNAYPRLTYPPPLIPFVAMASNSNFLCSARWRAYYKHSLCPTNRALSPSAYPIL